MKVDMYLTGKEVKAIISEHMKAKGKKVEDVVPLLDGKPIDESSISFVVKTEESLS